MFPIYRAIAYEDIQLTGGTTKPLVLTVDAAGTLVPFCGKKSHSELKDQKAGSTKSLNDFVK